MKLSELIAELQAYQAKHGEMEVLSLWEQHTTNVQAVYRAAPDPEDGPLPVLLLDVEEWESDRADFEHPEDRARSQ